MQQCEPSIDKIVSRIRYCCARLLSYAWKVQLIKSVLFAITKYLLLCFPLPKNILKHRKSPIAWEKVFSPKIRVWKANHMPAVCNEELRWVLSAKVRVLQLAFSETIYDVWKFRNDVCFGHNVSIDAVRQQIVDAIVYITWMVPNFKVHGGRLMRGCYF